MKLYFFFLLLFASIGLAQKKSCTDFKKGNFLYTDPEKSDWVIIRNDSTQIEYNTKTEVELHATINWISNCKYTLTFISILNDKSKSLIGKKINVEIISIKNNQIKYLANMEGLKIEGEMIQIYENLRFHKKRKKKELPKNFIPNHN